MNATRRKTLESIRATLGDIYDRILTLRNDDLVAVRDQEEESLNNLPESLQSSERGEKAQETIDRLDEAVSSLDTVESELQDAIQAIEDAAGS